MQNKRKTFNTHYRGKEHTQRRFEGEGELFDYGDLSLIETYNDTHPKVMSDMISRFDWKSQLRYSGGRREPIQKHEKLKYRFVTWLEQNIMGGNQLFGFKNYILTRK